VGITLRDRGHADSRRNGGVGPSASGSSMIRSLVVLNRSFDPRGSRRDALPVTRRHEDVPTQVVSRVERLTLLDLLAAARSAILRQAPNIWYGGPSASARF
jgi:hypothetical protein